MGLLQEVNAQIGKNNVLVSATGNVASTNTTINTSIDKYTSSAYSLNATYLFSKHLSLGIWAGTSQLKNFSEVRSNTIGISGRYYLNIGERWNFYSGLNAGYHVAKVESPIAIGTTESNVNGFVENVQLGLMFRLGKRWHIDVNSNIATFQQTTTIYKGGSESNKKSNSFSFAPDGLFTGIKAGICFVFGKIPIASTVKPVKE